MSSSYFPSSYFGYVIYGSTVQSQPQPQDPPNWLFAILQGVASSLNGLFGNSAVRIVIDPNDFGGMDGVTGTITEIGVASIDSVPFEESAQLKHLVIPKIEIRVRFRAWNNNIESVGLAISRVYDRVTSNSFGSTCIASKSRIVKFSSKHLGQGDYDLRFVVEAQRVVTVA